ncbi:FtsL-like putative cell division protein [Polaribacter gangjinensis]|uniref:S-adenosyl-methyltransferase n=1 Tax=Polaribacter gangjinensis TaxID=574710 RepID=A0A2S7WBT9_9FLAO|nr:FtsL-like putative cell division protein [Polaribacter gangjinensis]PQJ75095.1 S-adenosyl-methyltransferase [Polaribacter gangjinensis]
METKRKNIYDFLRGSFLTDESSFNNWRIIIFVVVLLLIMISSAHNIDRKGVKISELNKKKRELRAEHIDIGTILMRTKMESTIREKALKIGLKPSETPPKIIKVTQKK